MVSLGQIVCKTIGTAGMGIALYDAVQVANQFSRNEAHHTQAKYLDKIYFNSRGIDNVSIAQNTTREKTFDLMSRNPIPTLWGKIKGGFNGFFYGLGNMLPVVAFSALALVAKNTVAKIGATGVALCACYNILRNGFGLGKQNPMD